jgi:hypothetical protein
VLEKPFHDGELGDSKNDSACSKALPDLFEAESRMKSRRIEDGDCSVLDLDLETGIACQNFICDGNLRKLGFEQKRIFCGERNLFDR